MLKINRKNSFFLVGILLLILGSCDSKREFDTYISVKNNTWEINKPVTYQFEIKDTLAKKNLFLQIRNNNDYQYSNLFLITKMSFPDGKKVIDTLEYDMTDNTGKFLGSGFSDIKENKLFYKEGIVFPVTGNYTLSVSQAMRKNGEVEGIEALEGITDVGFRIEKINEK